MNHKILISVLNYNNFEATKKCVLSILKYLNNSEQIYIVDNNSPDDSYLKLKETFKNIKVVKSNFNGGYAAGHKIAVEYALKNNFELIWILNNDLIVRKNTLSELKSAYLKHGLGLYGSITLKSENPDVVNFGGGKPDDISKPLDYNAYENISLEEYNNQTEFRAVQSIEGSSFIVPIKVIKKYGFMREDFFMYGEETDYCYRLNKLGVKSYVVPGSIVIHKGGESLKEKKYLETYYRRRNFLYFEKTHHGKSIIKNIYQRVGITSFIKYFIMYILGFEKKDNNYYLNLANLHALFNKKGKLKE